MFHDYTRHEIINSVKYYSNYREYYICCLLKEICGVIDPGLGLFIKADYYPSFNLDCGDFLYFVI